MEDKANEELSVQERLTKIDEQITSPSVNRKLGLLKELRDINVEENATQLVDIIFRTLYLYHDRKSLYWNETNISKYAGQSATFVKVFLKRWFSVANSISRSPATTIPQRVRIQLLKWSCIIITKLDKSLSPLVENNNNNAFSLLIGQQISLLHNIASCENDRVRANASAAVVNMLEQQPAAFEQYISVLSKAEVSLQHAAIVGAVADYCVKSSELSKQYKSKFIEWFNKIILSSAVKPPIESLEAFAPLIRSMTEEDLLILLPSLVRVLKRGPELVMGAVAFTVNHLSVDLSKVAHSELLPNLIPHLRSANDSLRAETLDTIRKVVLKVADVATVDKVLQDLLKLLKEKLPYVYERSGVVLAIESISHWRGQNSNLLNAGINGLLDFVEAETNEEVKIVGLSAVGSYLSQLDNLPPKAQKIYTTGLGTDKEPLRMATLDSILASTGQLEAGEKLNQLKSTLLPGLLKIIQTSKTSIDAIYALRILLLLASKDRSVDEKASAEKIWTNTFKQDTVFFKDTFIAKLKDKDLSSLAGLYELILSHHFSKLKEPELKALYSAAVTLLTNKSWVARGSAISSIKNVHKFNPAAADGLSTALINLLQSLILPKQDSETSTPKLVYAAAIAACVSPSLSPSILPGVILAVHHPLASLPNSLKSVLKNIDPDIAKLLTSNIVAISESFFGSDGLKHQNSLQQQAAVKAIGAIVSIIPDTALPLFIPTVLKSFQSSQAKILALSSSEIGIYKTPEGQVYDQHSLSFSSKSTGMDLKSIKEREKRKRGEHRMYSAEDAEWEEKLRQELLKKQGKGAEQTVDPEQKAREDLLKKEHTIREQVVRVINGAILELQTITFMARSNPQAVHNCLTSLIIPLATAVSTTLISSQVLNTIDSLSICLAAELKPLNRRITTVLNQCLTIPLKQNEKDAALSNVLETTLSDFVVLCTKPLPAPSFSYCFPIIKTALLKSYTFSIQENALYLIELHTARGLDYPRTEMIESLVNLLSAISEAPRIQQRATDAILALAEGIEVPQGEEEEKLGSLLNGLLNANGNVRLACLLGLEKVPVVKASALPQNNLFVSRFWYAVHDTEQENAAVAARIWKLYGHQLPEKSYYSLLSTMFSRPEPQVQTIAAASVAGAIKLYPSTREETLKSLFSLYTQMLPATETEDSNFAARAGVAATIGACASVLQAENLVPVFDFLLYNGLLDNSDVVRQRMDQAALDIINEHGQSRHSIMLPIFENFLKKPSENVAQDRVRESVAIMMGNLAKHLGANHEKLSSIFDKLLEVLKTPSESVQRAVCKCLIPLMPLVQEQGEKLANTLLDRVQNGSSYAERRGAAYGIAGLVKGLGISSLKKYNIMTVLQAAVEDKRHPNARQGALFAFECLCNILERLFEPYVIQILPKLLVCYGDNVVDVRDATTEASKAIMSQLSAHGVKLVLPALLKALEDRSWRTKVGSVNLIGSMAFCAPRQLSSCLPTIVPRLAVVLTDTHSNVQEAAREALGHIGSVIRNPEIQLHVPILLKAIDDPDLHAREALDALIHTNFVHTIDSPSLSLIMPVLHRGLKERSTETKKKSAQIVGNMCSLAEHKDLAPYLDILVPDLKESVIDPIPEVRATAAKALGSLVKGLGEEQFTGLIPWFMETMRTEAGSVERSGAAQGLSEVLSGLDITRFEGLLPDILTNTNHARPHIREGHIGLFVFLPATLSGPFQSYLHQVLPCILQGLADEVEAVREISMRAGQAIVNQYANTSLELLLPTLEEGLFNDNWRIRQSSVQLLGELLYKVLGDREATEGEDSGKTLSVALGTDRRNSILAALYLIRSDVSSVVRQKGLMVWKAVVGNTPKTLREILPTLMRRIISSLGSANFDKRQVASKTLGDLVQKLGEKILPEIIPILENGLQSNDADTKQGVCLGLSEILATTSKAQLVQYVHIIIPAIRKALCDELLEVREAAAQAFDMLAKSLEQEALDGILPSLLESLQDRDSNALEGLRQILTVRSSVVLPFLVPKLLTPPITMFNVQALASIAEVAGPALNSHLGSLVPALIEAIVNEQTNLKEVRQGAETIVLAVQADGVHILFSELARALESPNPKARAEVATLIGQYCINTKTNIDLEIPRILENLLVRFDDPSIEVQSAACGALANVTNSIKKESISYHIQHIRNVLASIQEELQKKKKTLLPGFCLPKGLSPILPMFLNGLMLGSPEVREQSAAGLGDLINLTSEDALKPFVIQITGPLIRIIGDRFPWQVKSAILQTLQLLIGKGGPMLKPFLPQLQTTFIKALQDPTRNVRVHAATALGALMTLNARVDPLITELLNGITSSSGDIQETMLAALQQVLLKAGKTASLEALSKVGSVLTDILESEDDAIRHLAAKSIGAYSKFLDEKQLNVLVSEKILGNKATWQGRHGSCFALKSVLHHSPAVYQTHEKLILSVLLAFVGEDKPQIRQSSCEALGKIILIPSVAESSSLLSILNPIAQLLNDSTNDVKLTALKAVKNFAKRYPNVMKKHLALVVPVLMERVKDRTNFPVKLAAERAVMHALQIHTDPEVLKNYSQTIDKAQATTLVDYAKRVLAKLTKDSASEGSDEEKAE